MPLPQFHKKEIIEKLEQNLASLTETLDYIYKSCGDLDSTEDIFNDIGPASHHIKDVIRNTEGNHYQEHLYVPHEGPLTFFVPRSYLSRYYEERKKNEELPHLRQFYAGVDKDWPTAEQIWLPEEVTRPDVDPKKKAVY